MDMFWQPLASIMNNDHEQRSWTTIMNNDHEQRSVLS